MEFWLQFVCSQCTLKPLKTPNSNLPESKAVTNWVNAIYPRVSGVKPIWLMEFTVSQTRHHQFRE